MTDLKAPPPHLLKKFSEQARVSSQKRGAPNYLKTFATLCIEWAMNSKPTPNFSQIRSSVPEEVVAKWGHSVPVSYDPDHWGYEQYIASKAADWELEACCEWLRSQHHSDTWPSRLRAARRPKPPSLREQALADLDEIGSHYIGPGTADRIKTIRRALEALPDD